jgi:hypothetical protein
MPRNAPCGNAVHPGRQTVVPTITGKTQSIRPTLIGFGASRAAPNDHLRFRAKMVGEAFMDDCFQRTLGSKHQFETPREFSRPLPTTAHEILPYLIVVNSRTLLTLQTNMLHRK